MRDFRVRSSTARSSPHSRFEPAVAYPRWACRSPPAAQGSEVSPAARNTLDSARIPRASKLLICGLFQKGRVLAQDGQGREIAKFYSDDSKGFIPNALFAWGPQPHKGTHLFHRSLQRPLGRPVAFQGSFRKQKQRGCNEAGSGAMRSARRARDGWLQWAPYRAAVIRVI